MFYDYALKAYALCLSPKFKLDTLLKEIKELNYATALFAKLWNWSTFQPDKNTNLHAYTQVGPLPIGSGLDFYESV